MGSSHWCKPPLELPQFARVKERGKVRLCGDFKLSVNKVLQTETYPHPRVEELIANPAGGQYFTKLDMSNAYLQLPLDADSKQYVTINTHKGLPFGVTSPSAILQCYVDTLLQRMRGVSVYLDDIHVLIEEHLWKKIWRTLRQSCRSSRLQACA